MSYPPAPPARSDENQRVVPSALSNGCASLPALLNGAAMSIGAPKSAATFARVAVQMSAPPSALGRSDVKKTTRASAEVDGSNSFPVESRLGSATGTSNGDVTAGRCATNKSETEVPSRRPLPERNSVSSSGVRCGPPSSFAVLRSIPARRTGGPKGAFGSHPERTTSPASADGASAGDEGGASSAASNVASTGIESGAASVESPATAASATAPADASVVPSALVEGPSPASFGMLTGPPPHRIATSDASTARRAGPGASPPRRTWLRPMTLAKSVWRNIDGSQGRPQPPSARRGRDPVSSENAIHGGRALIPSRQGHAPITILTRSHRDENTR